MTLAIDDQITAGERRELRSVVRSQMKALRAEIKQREIELEAEIEKRLVEKYRDEDKKMDELQSKIRKLTTKSNEQLHKLVEEYEELTDGGNWRNMNNFNTPHVYRRTEKRDYLRQALQTGMRAEIRRAAISIDRQEADLLRDLALDSLKTSAAQAFLATIMSAQELVPARKIIEIEAQYEARV